MSRSVSYANGAFAVAYEDVNKFGYCFEDNEGNKLETPEYSEAQGSADWDWYIDNLKSKAEKLFPSFHDCDKWVGREDHAILENRFAYFGVSEYCGLVSIWLVLKDNLSEYDNLQTIAEHWASQIEKTFHKNFGKLYKVGTFSNGESIYKRKGE